MNKRIVLSLFLFSLCIMVNAAVYNVMDFGAINNGKTLTTSNIQSAIDKCFQDKGGVVYVPKGEYLVGTLNLRSNVEFRLEMGAVLIATTDLSQYQRHNEHLAGVFYTEDSENVAITGHGKIFGQGMEFMEKTVAKRIIGEVNNYIRQKNDFRKVEKGIGDGPVNPKERFHQMVIFSNCKNVTLTDFECIDAPYWTILIVHCDRVKVQGISIDNNLLIPNSDGLDIISCSNVNVSDCIITCGDDSIVLAGYAHHFGDPGFKGILKPSQNINVSNCIFQSRSSAIRIGGWDQNHMSNYNFDNITIIDSNCGINITVRDSGSVQNVNFTNIRIETRMHTGDWWGNGEPIKISTLRGVPDSPIGIVKNINFNNITCLSENAVLMYASDESKIENVYFNNFDFVIKKSALEKVSGGNFDLRPNTVKGKELYASDIPVVYIENAQNIYFNQGNLGWKGVEAAHYTYAIEAIKVDNLNLNNMTAAPSPSNPKLPVALLTKCTRVANNILK
ncbi:MAG: glycosyl hydrolase family 28 protein [Dysgonomonas sp.]|nr:glycosyl hydrolase family 28 protein [Dysgonomonas sp.]